MAQAPKAKRADGTKPADRASEAAQASDEALMARAGRGDRLAAGELTVRHADRVMAVCHRLLADRELAEDATQETFLRLWRAAPTWRAGEAKLSTWLYRVATNLCLDRLRRRKREAPEEAAPERVDAAPLADARLEMEERRRAVAAAIGELPERQRLALTLRHYEELSNADAAAVMDVSEEAVESLLARARRALKNKLAPRRRDLLETG
ncbi:MAG: RNA polymerase sigma factor [Parvularculaceae bacterium]